MDTSLAQQQTEDNVSLIVQVDDTQYDLDSDIFDGSSGKGEKAVKPEGSDVRDGAVASTEATTVKTESTSEAKKEGSDGGKKAEDKKEEKKDEKDAKVKRFVLSILCPPMAKESEG